MKRKLNVFFLAALMASLSMSCFKVVAQAEEDVVDTTEQVAFDDVEVEDYTVLSYSELEVLAYEGDTEAQVMLGRMLEYGTEDVRQNFAEAISWYQMASDSGNPEGTNALGYFYLTGTGIDKDLNRAKELFQTAVDGGIVNAKVGLARVMLAEGDYEALALQNLMEQEELKQDESKKEEVKEEKQENKKEEPKQEDSKKEETEDNDQEQQSEEETSSEENNELAQIVNLLTEAQKAGDLDGGYYLGYIYEKGIGVTQDYKKAFDYYNRVVKSTSTALNDRDSINLSNISLGLMYIKGYGVEANTEVALGYFQTASDNWSAKASYYIGQMYENAIGVDKDYEKAEDLYMRAEAAGERYATIRLDQLHEDMKRG